MKLIELAKKLYNACDLVDWDSTPQSVRDRWVQVASAAAAECNGVPVPMLLWCPECGARHIDIHSIEDPDLPTSDVGFGFKTPHHTHACQHCGACWRPAVVPTVGVKFLPGFKNR